MPSKPAIKTLIGALTITLLGSSLAGCVAYNPRYSNPPPSNQGHYDSRPATIAVAHATYGTWSRSCDATPQIAAQASGRTHIRIHVDNNLCGDPHQGRQKSLGVNYYCAGYHKTASANEHDFLTLSCP